MENKTIPAEHQKRLREFGESIEKLAQRREGYVSAVLDAMGLEGDWSLDLSKMEFFKPDPPDAPEQAA